MKRIISSQKSPVNRRLLGKLLDIWKAELSILDAMDDETYKELVALAGRDAETLQDDIYHIQHYLINEAR